MVKKIFLQREGYIVLMTLMVWVVISTINPNFARPLYLLDMAGYNSVYYICALGILPLMIMGGIDLSISGMILSTSMVVTMVLMIADLPVYLLLFVATSVGILFGLVNGALISWLNVSSVIVTLSTLTIYRGLTKYWFQQTQTLELSTRFIHESKTVFWGLSIQNWMILFMAIITFIVLKYHKVGRSIFAFGGNRELARRKGFDSFKTTLFVYGFSGFAAGLSAFMHILLLGQANIEAYSNLDFELIIIIIIGGLNILGGYGTVFGTFFATSFIVILKSGLVFARIPAFWHNLLIGLIIVGVVSYDMIQHRYVIKKRINQLEDQG
jgi:simple sugar transport system permease protein